MMNERLSSIMTRDVVTIGPDEPVSKVMDILLNKRFHHIPVVKGRKLVGIITSWDLVKLGKSSTELKDILVKDVMTTKVATLGPNELIGAAAQIFLKHLFHGLPIVDDEGQLVGIVTTHDILRYEFQKAYPDDAFIRDTRWMETT
ncbi:MAG: CBS domain-containing protein [Bacteroidetes bacterium]|nr:MAG: CBS domain-containing protein [Bacteroidota bacterium]